MTGRSKVKGRKRPGWKRAMLKSLTAASAQMGEVSGPKITEVIRQYRSEQSRAHEG